MFTQLERRMGRQTRQARPKKEADQGTVHIRVFDDIADMASWIIRVEGVSTAQLLDPLVRPQLTAKYAEYKKIIDKIKAAEEAVRIAEAEGQAKVKSPSSKPATGKPKGKLADPLELWKAAKDLPVL